MRVGKIRILPDKLVDQIAAGEVVERPASVVKELVENAIDAGATRITIELDGEGPTEIRVIDNGHGMSKEDLERAVLRHATSKVQTIDDITYLSTLGFRGEALPSIAAVSRMRITTRTQDSNTAFRWKGDDTKPHLEPRQGSIVETSASPGTQVEVGDLFYNVPARRKFLRSSATEIGHITDICTRISLSAPQLHIQVLRNGRNLREFLQAETLLEKAQALYPREKLQAFRVQDGSHHIECAIAPPDRNRGGMQGLYILVNDRAVRDRGLARALAYAYGEVMPPGRYPIGVLSLRLPSESVDANVHPQKIEVRFAEGSSLYRRITQALRPHLARASWHSLSESPSPNSFRLESPRPLLHDNGTAEIWPSTDTRDVHKVSGPLSVSPSFWEKRLNAKSQATRFSSPSFASEELQSYAKPHAEPESAQRATGVLAQIQNSYLLVEEGDSLCFYDQHKLDTYLRLARVQRAHERGEIETQRLLFPSRISCKPEEVHTLEEHHESIGSMGFDLALLSEDQIAIRAIPAVFGKADPQVLVRQLLEVFSTTRGLDKGMRIHQAFAAMAASSAIRPGEALSPQEASRLVQELFSNQEQPLDKTQQNAAQKPSPPPFPTEPPRPYRLPIGKLAKV